MGWRFASVLVASLAMMIASESHAATVATKIEIAPPPEAYATDANALRAIAAAELRTTETTARRVIVSLAVAAPKTAEPNECQVDATLRDERTGAVLAVVDATARAADGMRTLTRDERRALAHAAVRSAARRVTAARVP